MLKIRNAQFHAFQRTALECFLNDTVKHLETHFPDPCASAFANREEIRAFVEKGWDRASALNINTASAVTALLELWLQFGENFERSPIRVWTSNMLSQPELPGAAKVDVIRDRHLELTGGCVMVVY